MKGRMKPNLLETYNLEVEKLDLLMVVLDVTELSSQRKKETVDY